MLSKIRDFTNKKFVRNVLIMVSGTAAAQVVYMALSPVITRLYGPEAYGLMGVFMAVVGIIAPIAALTYPIAIVLPKSDRDAKGLMRISMIISIIIAIIFAVFIILFEQQIAALLGLESISSYLVLLPIVIIFSCFLQVTENWLIRTKQYRVTAKVSFFHALILQGSMALGGLLQPVATVLIVFSALSSGLKAGMMNLFAKRSNLKQIKEAKHSHEDLLILAKNFKDFPKYRAPQVFINAISQSLPVLLLASFFGPASAGFYSIARTVLNIPVQLIGKSVGDVFYPRITEASNNKENLTLLIKKATLAMSIVGILPFGVVIMFGPWLFSFVFGEEWITAGNYARWIAIWLYFMFINQPSIQALPVLSAQSFHLKFTVISLISRLVALLTGYFLFSSDIVAVALFALAGAILNISLIIITLYISSKHGK